MTKTFKIMVDPRKFSEYVFKKCADHGKDIIFKSLGYTKQHSEMLAAIYRKQGRFQFENQNFMPGEKDRYGRRITIDITLPGIGDSEGKTMIVRSGWMILPDKSVKLITPFSGFSGR